MSTWKQTADNNEENQRGQNDSQQTSSMTMLILWNINKALEKNPTLDLKAALRKTHDSLENEQVNVSTIVKQRPDERHLSCAVLAWQQLGHSHVDSLYSFVVAQMRAEPKPQINSPRPGSVRKVTVASSNVPHEKSFITHKESDCVYSPTSSSMSPPTMGPVLRLPVTPPAPIAPRVAIPVFNVQGNCAGGGGGGGLKKTGQDIKKRIETACCLESACLEKLTAVDRGTKNLRARLSKLAKREAERIELLERAETAWRDLEMGYMRRLRKCVEKEEEIAKKSTQMISERNTDKEFCVKLVQVLKPRGETAEQARDTLTKMEKEVCDRACERLNHSELAAKEDKALVELQCQTNQQDRDLQFKEEALRRKKATLEHELESVRGLTYETERTMKAELQGFKEQLKKIAEELLAGDEAIVKIKKERDELLQEKKDLAEDLEGCQKKCDLFMKKQLDQLKEKHDKLLKLKDQTMECKCKFPIETAVQVKRTPSLAALCYCSPEDRTKKSCSCMSMRSRLLSNCFVSLFEGLQFELADCSIKMPCELLKCLEDSYNWDKASIVKTNLRSFFAKMLCGELDIAIVNSIENYHARYVGTSCADMGRPIPDYDDKNIEQWQDRALAQKAHWMAEAMAEQMFQERVDDIMQQARQVVSDGPPPCKCKPPPKMPKRDKKDTAVYQLFVDPVMPSEYPQHDYEAPAADQPQPTPISMTSNNNNNPLQKNVTSKTNIKQNKSKEEKHLVKVLKESSCSTVARTVRQDVLLLKAGMEDLKKSTPISMTPNNNNNPLPKNVTSKTNIKQYKSKEEKHLAKVLKEPACSTIARTLRQDVLLLKAGMEDLKKSSIKKQDLKKIEQTIKKLVRKASGSDSHLGKSSKENDPATENKAIDTKNIKSNKENGSSTENKSKDSKNIKSMSVNRKATKKKKFESKFKRQYAVNLCFCGIQKNCSRKFSKQKSHEVIIDSNEVLKQKSSREIISQNISLIQSKPIEELHSEEYNLPEQRLSLNIQSEKVNTCGSKCGCFNKIPSSSSIDRLLETLMKWKSDLNKLPVLSNEVESEVNLKKTSQVCSSNIKDTSAIMCQSVLIKDGCIEDFELNKSDKMINAQKIPKYNFGLLATESEYMGTVNLEKSTENISRCVEPIDNNKECINNKASKDSKSRKSIQSKTFCKCESNVMELNHVDSKRKRKVKSEEYRKKNNSFIYHRQIKSLELCKPLNTIKTDINYNINSQNKPNTKKHSSNFKSGTQDKIQIDMHKTVPLLLVNNQNTEQLKEHVSFRSNYNSQQSFDHELTNSNESPCGCEYQIKLIGVTLENINSDKKCDNRFIEKINEVPSLYPKAIKYQKQEDKVVEGSDDCILPNSFTEKSMERYDLFRNSKTNANVTELEQPLCQCKSKINEIKDLLFNIYKGKREAKNDKAQDTNSLKADLKCKSSNFKDDLKVESSKDGFKDENCVCCVDLTNESNELEANTFHLLQEHIRKKLENLKDTYQSSYCIKPDEEDKSLKRLFMKIRETITDSTGKIACRCSEEANQKGSWQRAYNLLQEYLKIKIGRVECTCSPEKNGKESILPELTDKVCILIEKDFERLKEICKCRSKGKSNKSYFEEETKFQVPEKDSINKTDKNENSSLKKSSGLNELSSKSYIIATQNTSAQVIPNFETRSCEAIRFSDPDKSTVETQILNEIQCLQKACSVDYNFLDATKIVSNHSTQYSRGNDKELESNALVGQYFENPEYISTDFKELAVELKQKEKESDIQPYIGLTIDCTCSENLRSCGCSKSKIGDSNKAIAEFWATYTKSKDIGKNVSYLMKNTYESAIALPDNMTHISPVNESATQCTINNKKVNTKSAGGLTLKDSREYFNKPLCHGGTNTDDDEIVDSSVTDDSSDETSYELNLDTGKDALKKPKRKSVHFLHRSKSEATDGSKASVYNPDCDCSKVPVCHVKMLVENIEGKLANAECTCDSLSSKVCPVHSKREK